MSHVSCYPRFTRRVRLRSGGEISLAVEASVADLSPRDGAFLLTLIQALDQYQAGEAQPPKEQGAGDV